MSNTAVTETCVRELLGQVHDPEIGRSLAELDMVDPADEAKPKLQRATVYFDHPLRLR